ncbi:MAG: zinc ribbon domain-containing protein [Promethearchaeota archaeon]
MRRKSLIGLLIGLTMTIVGLIVFIMGLRVGFPQYLFGIIMFSFGPMVIVLSFQKEMRKWAMKRSAFMMKEMMEDPNMKEMIENNPMMQMLAQKQLDAINSQSKESGKTPMICPNCGNKIDKDSKFCKECGVPIY